MSSQSAVAPGQRFTVALEQDIKAHWHTYWQNPGDSGLPTRLQWQLPAGLQAGEIDWPLPKKIPIGTLANYGYEGTVLLAVPVTVTRSICCGSACWAQALKPPTARRTAAAILVCFIAIHPRRTE